METKQKISIPIEIEIPEIRLPHLEVPLFVESFVPAKVACKVIGKSERVFNELVVKGIIPFRKVGKERMYLLSEVQKAFPAVRME